MRFNTDPSRSLKVGSVRAGSLPLSTNQHTLVPSQGGPALKTLTVPKGVTRGAG